MSKTDYLKSCLVTIPMDGSTKERPYPNQAIAAQGGRTIAQVRHIEPGKIGPKATARLLVGSYNAVLRGSTELGVNAIDLAESLNIGELYRARSLLFSLMQQCIADGHIAEDGDGANEVKAVLKATAPPVRVSDGVSSL